MQSKSEIECERDDLLIIIREIKARNLRHIGQLNDELVEEHQRALRAESQLADAKAYTLARHADTHKANEELSQCKARGLSLRSAISDAASELAELDTIPQCYWRLCSALEETTTTVERMTGKTE